MLLRFSLAIVIVAAATRAYTTGTISSPTFPASSAFAATTFIAAAAFATTT